MMTAKNLARKIRRWEFEEGFKLWSPESGFWSTEKLKNWKTKNYWGSMDGNYQQLYMAVAARIIKELRLNG